MILLRSMVFMIALLLMTACVPSQGLLKLDGGEVKINQAPAKHIEGMARVRHVFYAGKVMEAYKIAQAMTVKDKEYAEARMFLKKTINPARIRLLRHYKRIAQQAMRAKKWDKAWFNYKQTAEFSAKPEVFNSNIRAMYLHLEQLRLHVLLKQRRLEDHALLQGLTRYVAPKGVAKHDVVFLGFAERHRKMLENRAKQAYVQAKVYFESKKIVAAYVLVESNLRLMPDSVNGEALLGQIQKVWLKDLQIPRALKKQVKKVVKKKEIVQLSKPVKKVVVLSKVEIQALLKQRKWSEAQDAALLYQQHDGEGGDELLQTIDVQIQQAAEKAFQQGSLAFQQEHIDQAVKLWDQALQLEPQNEEYLDALSRALSLQERLHLLRHKK
ncbi:MAG: hypothetical protein COA61_009655 [Zetaproteobacteria bacterium]|nr:hypothetical protein [Zetaproteobacteria bacterium]